MYRILVVEDDPGIAQAVCAHLRQWELEARCVQNFRAVMDEFTAFDPQLVLLDISLPFFNGYHWCTQIRSVSRVPVMFLSSAAENMNIVMAMNMGADDFIAKPFDLDVLTAKVQALLRRTYDFAAASPVLSHRGAVLQTGDRQPRKAHGGFVADRQLRRREHAVSQHGAPAQKARRRGANGLHHDKNRCGLSGRMI